MEWTDEQLKIVLESAGEADGGCDHCVRLVLEEFFRQAGFSLLPRMEILSKDCRFGRDSTWEDVHPTYGKWEKKRPKDQKYWDKDD